MRRWKRKSFVIAGKSSLFFLSFIRPFLSSLRCLTIINKGHLREERAFGKMKEKKGQNPEDREAITKQGQQELELDDVEGKPLEATARVNEASCGS